MAISKVIYKTSAEDTGTVWMDTTDKTVAADKMVSGITALKNDGTTVTGNLTSRSSSDLTASGATVTVPAGVYSSQASKAVSSGSATAPATISGSSATVSTGTNTLTLSKTVSVTPTVSAGYVSSGTAGNSAVSLTASVNTRSSSDLTASTLTVTAPAGYYGSDATKTLTDANLLAENIKKDISIFGVTGSYEGGGGQTSWEQQYVGSVTASDWGEQLNYIVLANYFSTHSDFAYGEIYRITWKNSTQYTCVAEVEIPDGAWTGYVLGNGELWGEQFGNNEPFIAQRYGDNLVFATTETASTTFTLTIEKQVSGGGSTGLEYETGTWTPASDVADSTISFANTHSTAPFYYLVSDATGTYDDTLQSNFAVSFYDLYNFSGEPVYVSTSIFLYGQVAMRYRSTSATGQSSSNQALSVLNDNTNQACSTYWATNTGIRAYTNSSSRYWRSGRSYKWIAVWKPTT